MIIAEGFSFMEKVILAPAKINLCLHVLGKRPDGYHELAMIMQRVSLYDRVRLVLSGAPGVRVACRGLALAPGEENIAARAARSLLRRAPGQGVDIFLEKEIPTAAGLGGGSSDAAAVLVGLDEMLGLGLSREELMAEGAALGADVPFFIFGGAALATGIGTELAPVDGLPAVWYVLVNPGVAVSTAWVYGNLGLTTTASVAKLPGFPRTIEELTAQLHNDLEGVTAGHYPQIGEVKQRLLQQGAAGALMSGSGPTVFGVFASEDAARRGAAALTDTPGWKVFVVQPV